MPTFATRSRLRRLGAIHRFRSMCRRPSLAVVCLAISVGCSGLRAESIRLAVGFASIEITPAMDSGRPVWLAGYGPGRQATGVHDPLYARTVVLTDGTRYVALVSVDLVGLQYPEVQRIRSQLPEFDYVMVSSTHNHEGPDTIGIWGPSPIRRGVDDAYLTHVVDRVVQSIRAARQQVSPAQARFGTAVNESLLGDSRLPQAKDGALRLLQFVDPADSEKPLGIIVQWNCHPEALGSKNTLITADFCAATVAAVERAQGCPVVYFTGAVGGLMAPPDGLFQDADGRVLQEGEFEYAEAYGRAVADLANQAVGQAQPLELAPIAISRATIAIPLENPLYRTARLLGIIRRRGIAWTGDFRQADQPVSLLDHDQLGVATEVACLRLGTLDLACIPGELYPELVYGQFQDPAEPHVDDPQAPLEKTIEQILPSKTWMLFGLANDELGYIIPRRQWDFEPPFAYGRSEPQYGEINSCGKDVAPIIMQALAERIAELEP